MESTADPSDLQRSMSPPPNLSDLRIILLGKNSSEISRVGNFILGREAFDPEAPPPSVEQHSERAGGTEEGRYITLINTPHLFHPQLSLTTLDKRVRECASLCSPGPHVLMLVLQPDDFTETDRHRLNYILHSLSEDPHKHTLVVTTHLLQSDSCVDPAKENVSQRIITEYTNTHVEFSRGCSRSDLVEMVVKMVVENEGSHLKWKEFEDAPVAIKQRQHEQTAEKTKQPKQQISEKSSKEIWSERLNLVVCGSEGSVKSSISDLILGQREFSAESSSVCVKREAEVCGRLITLVELPALYNSQLSEEEVMQETLRCVSLCDPGVHAFLFIIPEGRLTDEDKGELEKIQRIFGLKLNSYIIVFISTENLKDAVLDDVIRDVAESGKVLVRTLEANIDKSVILQKVEHVVQKNSGSCYTSNMYLEAQMETQLKYKSENEELKKTINNLKEENKHQTQESSSDTGGLRIVLMGKTGVGKSATGNTILQKEVFKELLSSKSVTSVCQKESAEVRRRRVTVIDTPGLFDTSISNKEIIKEIAKCITMAAPGPHVFLLVLTVGQRFTQEEKEAVKMIQDRFGEESRRYTMVLFTRGDDLRKRSIEDYIKDSERSLQNIINQCGNRYHVFNNINPEDQTQVTDLLEKIDCMVAVNGGSCYTNEMFQNTEKALQEEQQRILNEKKEEIEREKEELRAKHEAELEKLKKIVEKERQNVENEKKIQEEEFQKKEAQIKETNEERKKELDEKLKEQRKTFKKEMEKKEQTHKKQLKNDLQYQKDKYEREKENIKKQAEEKARRQAEEEFCAKLEKETKRSIGALIGSVLGPLGAIIGASIGKSLGAD